MPAWRFDDFVGRSLEFWFRLMYNFYSRILLTLFFGGWLIGVNLCGTVSARITGNASFSYDLIKEKGKWSGEFAQKINFGTRGRAGLERLLGLNFGVVGRGKELSFLKGLTPTYALNLRGRHYTLSSGYSARMYRNIINSRLYENLSVFLPGLPTFRLAYSKQGTISPIPTIALSGTTDGRREQRVGQKSKRSSAFLTNRLQLMLQPVEGILMNAIYSKSTLPLEEGKISSNESKSLSLNVEPWQYIALSGNFTIYESFEQERRLSTLRRNSFDLRAEPIEGLRISSRLDLSKSADFVSGLRGDRNNVTTRLEAMPTRNFRTDISYDWQKFSRKLRNIIDEETQHRVTFAANYSFARMLNFNFRSGKNISSKWKGSTTFLSCGLNYSKDKSYVNFRYNRVSSPGRSPLSLREKQRATRSLTVEFGQKVGRGADLRLSYESRFGGGESGYRGTKRISFRMNIRF